MISRIFIERPVFAWVLAILVMMGGLTAVTLMPRSQYPDIAPTQVTIRAVYPGASAQTVENSVTQIIEQSLTGIDGLLYFSARSTSRGQGIIVATFAKGVDPDIAQVQVQNQVQQAVARLPAQVQQQGIVVRKANPDEVFILALYDETDRMSNLDVADYLTTNLQDALGRISGVGDSNVYGASYAMRIWLDPAKLAAFQLMPSDVVTAIRNQNSEVASGEIGAQPQPEEQMLSAIVTAQSRLQTTEQFAAIVLKTTPSGAVVRIDDVARVEKGADNYLVRSRMNGHPGAGMAVMLAPGADALATADRIKAEVSRQMRNFPPGLKIIYSNDITPFIRLSIDEVVKTLLEAIILVVIVMFLFLQSWRATLIPAIAVPVVLLGTFGILYLMGYSINTMTLFGLVLAIGLLVDDAIVVVENVERLMQENPGMTPREATIRSMSEINVALIAIALILSAVFMPMAMFGGSTGVIYRQFSVTIIAAMTLSVLVALILSPALAASLLKRHDDATYGDGWLTTRLPRVAAFLSSAAARMQAGEHRMTAAYARKVRAVINRRWLSLSIYVLISVLLVVLVQRMPTGFLPGEDQGRASVEFRLPAGATEGRTNQVAKEIEGYFAKAEPNLITSFFVYNGAGGGQNTGNGSLNLTDWKDRTAPEAGVDAIVARAAKAFRSMRDADVFALVPPPIRGLGQSSGFTMELLNSSGMSMDEFQAVRDKLLEEARADPLLAAVRMTELSNLPQLRVNADPEMLSTLGLRQEDVNGTLATAWGGAYVNDFMDRGRVKRVYVQGDAQYRHAPEDIDQWFVRGTSGQMVPFSAFAKTQWSTAPASLPRFNGLPASEIQGMPAPGVSSGQAMARIEQLATAIPGVSVAWAGASYQERLSSGQAPILYALSLIVIFLCLAALYESWSIPVAVLLVVPLGLVGAVVAVALRGLVNDIYFQIGLLMTMGLAAKNAILIVEFAEQAERRGSATLDAVLEAARLRLRPILMTSAAFIFGVLPLALATGAGANSRIAIGTAVIGGMISATILAIFFIPLFYLMVRRIVQALSWRFPRKNPVVGEQANV